MTNTQAGQSSPRASAPATYSAADIAEWNVEDSAFWDTKGKGIANRNPWISIPNLLCGFAIWAMWGIITVQMLNLGFPFKPADMFTLTAISGLMGATLRIPASFFIRLCGGRNTIFLTSALLIIPAFGTGIALQDKTTPLWVFQIWAFLSGVGGGNFECSMSNINGFFPKRLQGTALGLNAGLGNFGVTTIQVLIPLVMTVGLFGAAAGAPMTLLKDSGWILGKISAGTPTFIQNAGFIWAAILVPLVIAAWFGMNNLLPLSPSYGGTLAAFAEIVYLWGLTFLVGGLGLYLYLPAPTGLGLLNMWVALPLIMLATLFTMKLAAFGEMKGNIAKQFEIFRNKHTWAMGVERELVLTPLMHDSPSELAQPFEVQDWKRGECELIPGKTAPNMQVVERDYPNVYKRFTALGPLMGKVGNGGKGIAWNTQDEVKQLGELNGLVTAEGPTLGMPKIESDIDASEVVLMLAPETNGHVAVKAWKALRKQTGRDHTHLAIHREDEKIRFRDIQAQPRKIISSPTWSGIESETVSYNAGYTNAHEMIPWRTLTGRQQFYMDHPWMRAFGEGFSSYRPPVDLKTTAGIQGIKPNGHPEIALNFITPHQKWGIHSTYTDNLLMLTLSRGGPCVWISEDDAKRAGIVDNDWIELFNINGAIAARAVVSQRVNPGMVMMYHAQEKIVNTPGSEITGARGSIHNSVTRIVLKPTHMIGGYAQFSYGFNYYGTIGTNRDEFVVVRKMNKIDWLDTPVADELIVPVQAQGEVA